MKRLVVWSVMLVTVPIMAWAFNPCDPVAGPCAGCQCVLDYWGIQVTVHADSFKRFEVYRQLCGSGDWSLVYDGPLNAICDCTYVPTGKYRYKVLRYWGGDSLADSCTSAWWTGTGQLTTCP